MSNDKKEITNRRDAIKAKCLDCCCNQYNEVKLCPSKDCALWPFRLGKDPFHVRTMTDEQRKVMSERARARFSKAAK